MFQNIGLCRNKPHMCESPNRHFKIFNHSGVACCLHLNIKWERFIAKLKRALMNTRKTNRLQEFEKPWMETEFIFKFSGRKQMKIKLTHSFFIRLLT